MIALCATHHEKADAWTVEQIRRLKESAPSRSIEGSFEWRRKRIVSIIGGNLMFDVPYLVVYREIAHDGTWIDYPVVFFSQNEFGELSLNLQMLSASNEPRVKLMANDWIVPGEPVDIESPPSGSRLKVTYKNGDLLSVRFREWGDVDSFESATRLDGSVIRAGIVDVPFVTVEVEMKVADSSIEFGRRTTKVGGLTMGNSLLLNFEAAVIIRHEGVSLIRDPAYTVSLREDSGPVLEF
jgi:hypothetical protein